MLRASNDALSREAEEERTRAVAAKAAELEARECAVRDAEERSEKVRAAAEALEAESSGDDSPRKKPRG